ETIAASVDSSLGDFVNTFFLSEVEAFLRGIFAASIESGMLPDDAWERLVQTTDRLGLPTRALSSAILPQALQLIEHVLANAKSDGEFTEAEEAQIQDLLCKLSIPNEERRYIDKAVSALATIRRARKGQLPVVPCPTGLAVRAGEIIHFHAPAAWRQVRVLKSGNVLEEHVGTVTITDNRLFFSSSTKSFDVRYAKIVGHAGGTGKILLQRMEKPECSIHVREDEPFMYAILEGAIALANQTRLARRTDEGPVRHIPRDVRQRVWQRYGGRCAECGDGQYLEFDHVIPFAKGGGNSDNNVQLLCRSCNLKKSDRI
ncbi:MAG TPA: HNH endonuclease signature motif containing protein, partial [Lacipirellulaceae bacterium]|nr:HNH endonuclease signature motif containing protein [Lacipirellulaceae bacterium]